MESDIDYGMMAVDWEGRVGFVRLRHIGLLSDETLALLGPGPWS